MLTMMSWLRDKICQAQQNNTTAFIDMCAESFKHSLLSVNVDVCMWMAMSASLPMSTTGSMHSIQ